MENSVEMRIEGMMCMHCAAHVTKALEAVPGVREVKVEPENKRAILAVGEGFELSAAKAAVEGAGYRVL